MPFQWKARRSVSANTYARMLPRCGNEDGGPVQVYMPVTSAAGDDGMKSSIRWPSQLQPQLMVIRHYPPDYRGRLPGRARTCTAALVVALLVMVGVVVLDQPPDFGPLVLGERLVADGSSIRSAGSRRTFQPGPSGSWWRRSWTGRGPG